MKKICKKCGYIQNIAIDPKEKSPLCKRCKTNELHNYGSVIKLYYRCDKNHCFKITEPLAIAIFARHTIITCPLCGSGIVMRSTKRLYNKFSGQAKKINEDQIQKTLSEGG